MLSRGFNICCMSVFACREAGLGLELLSWPDMWSSLMQQIVNILDTLQHLLYLPNTLQVAMNTPKPKLKTGVGVASERVT